MSSTRPLVPADPDVHWPGVTVVVAAYNAAATLRACLDSLRALDYPVVEILVVDDGSTDETAAIAHAGGARVLVSPRGGPAAARNIGVEQATHDIVAFTDADCVVPGHWLRALVDGLRTSRAAGAGGPQRNVFTSHAGESARDLDLFFSLASVIADYTRADDEPHEVEHNASCNVAYVRHTLVEVGGFTPGLYPGEDVDLDYRLRRLGYRCFYVPEAWVEHHRPGTREWFAGMMRRYGQAQRTLVDRYGRFRPLHYLPLGTLVFGLAQLLWVPRRTRWLTAAIDGVFAIGALALLARRVPLDRWPSVLDYARLALVEWHRGYLEGLPRAGAPVASARSAS
jgi:glycosyltransferase involved in cell wall biosynthesis